MPNSLLIVHVDVAVVPAQIDAFLDATQDNAAASRDEPGVVRFDVLSDRADSGHVVLVEIFRDEASFSGGAQGDRPLPAVARDGGTHDGPTSGSRPLRQRLTRGQ